MGEENDVTIRRGMRKSAAQTQVIATGDTEASNRESAAATQVIAERTSRDDSRDPSLKTALMRGRDADGAEEHYRAPSARAVTRRSETVNEMLGLDPREADFALVALPDEPSFKPDEQPRDGQYILGDQLGVGGMGRVLAARDVDLSRTVALKTLLPDAKHQGDLIRALLFEARIAGQLEHPHIVPVHDVGCLQDGSIYYTMKLMGEMSLRDVLKKLRDNVDGARQEYTQLRLLTYFRGICMATAYAHSRGVVHCDLKPDNVLIGPYGEVQIMDWGVARLMPRSEGERGFFAGLPVSPGLVAGTPHYMSPEQARGESERVDGRSDVYSLGVILYQLMTFTLPFRTSNTEDQLEALLNKPIPLPSLRAPSRNVPPELEAICMKALSAAPEERYADAMDMWSEIESFLEGRKEQARLDTLAKRECELADKSAQRFYQVRQELEALGEEVRQDEAKGGYFEPMDVRRDAWRKALRVQHLQLLEARLFAGSVARYNGALAHRPRFPSALTGLQRLYESKAMDAKVASDSASMLLYSDLARACDVDTSEEPAVLHVRSYPEGAVVRLHELTDEGDLVEEPTADLGVAPLTTSALSPGSYLLSGELPGFRETRKPVVLRAGESRFELLTLLPWSSALPIIGHAYAMNAIKDALSESLSQGHLVSLLLTGPPGFGKGRLLLELDRHLDALPNLMVYGFVRLNEVDRVVPFSAASRLLRHRFGVGQYDSLDEVRDKIRATVSFVYSRNGLNALTDEMVDEIEENVELVSQMPGLCSTGERPPGDGVAHTLRIFRAVGDVLERFADYAPIVFVLRDVQYLDRLSRDLFQYLMFRLEESPVFMLGMSEYEDVGLTFQSNLELVPLSKQGVRHELSVLLKGPIATDLVEAVFAKTEGNPFFIAEMARHLVTSRAIVWNGRHWSYPDAFDRTAESESMTMDDILLAKIRELPGKAQTLLQAAATCGHTFWAGLLESMLGYDPTSLLELLAERDIIFAQARSRYRGEQEYAFKHYRVRRTVYRQNSGDGLQGYHAAVAAWLMEKGVQKLTDAAWIAYHSGRAGDHVTQLKQLERLAVEAACWEHQNAVPWSKWPEEPSSGVFTTSG